LHLNDSDPAVVAFDEKIMADLVIFYLGRQRRIHAPHQCGCGNSSGRTKKIHLSQGLANMLGIELRLIKQDGGYTYKDISEDEARFALQLGHHLMVKLLWMQNNYLIQGRLATESG
jgi:hypothetical protein